MKGNWLHHFLKELDSLMAKKTVNCLNPFLKELDSLTAKKTGNCLYPFLKELDSLMAKKTENCLYPFLKEPDSLRDDSMELLKKSHSMLGNSTWINLLKALDSLTGSLRERNLSRETMMLE